MSGWEIAAIISAVVAGSAIVGGSIWNLSKTIERLTSSFEASQKQCTERHTTLDSDRQERCVWIQNVENKVDSHIKWHAQKG